VTKDEAKRLICSEVSAMQGCKITELLARPVFYSLHLEGGSTPEYIPDLIEELIKENRLVEINYTLPNMPYRLKTFLLPAGSRVQAVVSMV
jgi:hypothetical protein